MMVNIKEKVKAKDFLVAKEGEELEQEWWAHEKHVHKALRGRGEINEKIKSLIGHKKDNPHSNFEIYWAGGYVCMYVCMYV